VVIAYPSPGTKFAFDAAWIAWCECCTEPPFYIAILLGAATPGLQRCAVIPREWYKW